MHNGEINTIKGNVNWMRARQRQLIQTLFGEEHTKIQNIVDEDGSDSAIVDNALEFLSLAMEPEEQRCCLFLNHGYTTKKMTTMFVRSMSFIAI